MKQNATCPKCNSREVIRIPGTASDQRVGNTIVTGFFSIVRITRYVCGQCGFNEEWIDSPEDLEKLRKKFGTYGTGVVGYR